MSSTRRGSSGNSADESKEEAGSEWRRLTKEPTMTKFSEKNTDIEHFLTGFERVAMAYKWPEKIWVLKLVPLLTGRALAAYTHMDQMHRKTTEK